MIWQRLSAVPAFQSTLFQFTRYFKALIFRSLQGQKQMGYEPPAEHWRIPSSAIEWPQIATTGEQVAIKEEI
jgi:hypothetical protein